jgi:hypothetical protein
LQQWRTHVDKSVALGVVPGAEALRASGGVIVASPEKPLAPVAHSPMIQPRTQQVAERVAEARVAKAPVTAVPPPEAPKVSRKDRRSRAQVPTSRPARKHREPKRPEVVDPENAFAYRACSTCQETDWIVRTKRNEDETWNYWCVRCSRSFKTDVKLGQAVKPFLFSGIVVGGLAAASILMLR